MTANIKLNGIMLMHETRSTPSPLNGSKISDRFISFQWPLPESFRNPEMSGKKIQKSSLKYKLRYSKDKNFPSKCTFTVDTIWPFYNPETPLEKGTWYWQYGYIESPEKIEWSAVNQVDVLDNPSKFVPPPFSTFISKLPTSHPRVLIDNEHWQSFIDQSESKEERQWFIDKANEAISAPMEDINKIPIDHVKNLKNAKQIDQYLTRESRRIIDSEEMNCEAFIRAYLLTKDERYLNEGIKRIIIMSDWTSNENVRGDFNESSVLSLCSLAYDSFYSHLTAEQKETLLNIIISKCQSSYKRFNNNLENHLADNHVWQMTLRIFTFAAISVYDDVEEATLWTNYAYNVWLARFPGLNKDGGWHNGDSYFMVNARTLIEVPFLYSRITGFDFFTDQWYDNNIMYTIYQQPPFSKSAGNGSGHLGVTKPSSVRIGYLDALAKLRGNTYAADFVRRTLEVDPLYLKKSLLAKAGDLSWFRLQCNKKLPEGKGLDDLPCGRVFPETGVATFMTNWNKNSMNAMWSFRSSPYGSTSHALANQNSFNTFFGGKPLFYSSGHHISFVDAHSMLCERSTRAHNSILADGMGQRIGTEGYGWIPRYFVDERISYILGDASNAYGKVVSETWLKRGKEAEIDYSPENGWDENHVKLFRRHVVDLGKTGYIFIYDELEGDKPIQWSYLLHTVTNPMIVDDSNDNYIHIEATNKNCSSDAYLLSTGKLTLNTTDMFFYTPDNWLRADKNGVFQKYGNHWHFSATSDPSQIYRFVTIINTHSQKHPAKDPVLKPNGNIKIGKWIVNANLSNNEKPSFSIKNNKEEINIEYLGEETTINIDGKSIILKDIIPELEI